MTPFGRELKKLEEDNDPWCAICSSPIESMQDSTQCNGCWRYYHPDCINMTLKDVQQNKFIATIFHCPLCSSQDVWMVRNT